MNTLSSEITSVIGEPIDQMTPLGGGSICEVYQLTAGRKSWCLKTRANAPPDFFAAEAAGLAALERIGEVRVPRVIQASQTFLLLEWLPPRPPESADEARLGRQLAALHADPCDGFGFSADNYCGLTPQRNDSMADGHEFFAQCRLLPQADRAHRAGLLSADDVERIHRIAASLHRWIPHQPPSLLHGDLWQGNIHHCDDGPALIDPACHQGWGEADLAMTRLFGSMTAEFYAAYRELRPLTAGFEERAPLYNLYHLLNHLNLFGSGWLPQVRSVLDRWA